MLCLTCGIDTAPDWDTCPLCGARGAGIQAAPATVLHEPIPRIAPARHHRLDPLLRLVTTAVVVPPTSWLLWSTFDFDSHASNISGGYNPFKIIWPSLPMLTSLITCAFLMLLPRFTVTAATVLIAVILAGVVPTPAYHYIQEFLRTTIHTSAPPANIPPEIAATMLMSVVAVTLCLVLLRRAGVLGIWGGSSWIAILTYTALILADLGAFLWDFNCLDSEHSPSFFCPMFQAGESTWQDMEVVRSCAALALLVLAARTTADQLAAGLTLGIVVDQTSDVVLWLATAPDWGEGSVFRFPDMAPLWSSLAVVTVLTTSALLRLRKGRRAKNPAERVPNAWYWKHHSNHEGAHYID